MPSILSQFSLLARVCVCPYDTLVKRAKSLGNLPLHCLPALNLLNSHPIYDIFFASNISLMAEGCMDPSCCDTVYFTMRKPIGGLGHA